MKKLIFRLLVLILSVYVAGSIYPLLAHEKPHGPPQTGTGAPPTTTGPPIGRPTSPVAADTKGPGLPPTPPLTLDTFGEPTTWGCGGPIKDSIIQAEEERKAWREEDFDGITNEKINEVKEMANLLITSIREDIKEAQDLYHRKDRVVKLYEKYRPNKPELGQPRLEERKLRWEELQRQKGRLEKAEAWRHQKIGEIQALRDRAKSGDYHGYRGLRDYDCTIPPDLSDLLKE